MISLDKAGEVLFVDLPENPVACALLVVGLLAVGGLAVYGAKKLIDEIAGNPDLRAGLQKMANEIKQPELRIALKQLLENAKKRPVL